ncbi:MAG TPA: D-glycero-beta-D-manno-heptose 1-phosphate adenylyltransferase [Anaerolineae bacterium]
MDARRTETGGALLEYIQAFGNLHVLVIGDAMLDVYLEGYSDRLCREAPVPVVTITGRRLAPGGAANTAANIASLGGKVTFLSLIGDDADGALLRQALEDAGVGTDDLLANPKRQTIAKRRILAAGQVITRYDEGSTGPVTGEDERALCRRLRRLFPSIDAVVVSDYRYGTVTPRLIETLTELQAASPRVLMVDAKNLQQYRQVGITAVKPNYSEACGLLGVPPIEGACARADQLAPHGDRILELTGAALAAVTLDTEGALIFSRDGLPYRTYARPRPDSHAAGAGDTFIAALTLALGAGAETPTAAELASAAAAMVVAREGTTSCSAQELWEHLVAGTKYVASVEQLASRLAPLRQGCHRVVFTNGCFDILHRGHVAYLNQAKSRGDILVLAVNADASVRRLKGPERPINTLEDRVQVLSALSCVDFILSFEEDTPVDLLRTIRPDVYVKGGDYTRESLPEAPVVEEMGGKVEILPYIEARSTSGLIKKIRGAYAGVSA